MSISLESLLLIWEEGAIAGDPLSPEELCRSTPELLEPLKEQIEQLNRMAWVNPDRRSPCRIGQELLQGYRLVRFRGSGGSGEVWEVVDQQNQKWALKIIHLDRPLAQRELRSLEILQRKPLPGLISVLKYHKSDTSLFIQMELADESLRDRLNATSRTTMPGFSHSQVISWLKPVATTLDSLSDPPYQAQHRDIKPANLLVVQDQIKIGDFGLLRILKRSLTSHTGGLSVPYAPPEFFRGQTSVFSDQYSLAVTYYELRTGQLPFNGSPEEIMRGHLEGQPNLSGLSPKEQAIISRALAKQPHQRWPSCATFIHQLEHLENASTAFPSRGSNLRQARWILVSLCIFGISLFALSQSDRIDVDSTQPEKTPVVLRKADVSGTKLSPVVAKVEPSIVHKVIRAKRSPWEEWTPVDLKGEQRIVCDAYVYTPAVLEAWIWIETKTPIGDRVIFGHEDGMILGIRADEGMNYRLLLSQDWNGDHLSIGPAITSGQWLRIGLVIDESKTAVYLNRERVMQSGPLSGELPITMWTFGGAKRGQHEHYFHGKLRSLFFGWGDQYLPPSSADKNPSDEGVFRLALYESWCVNRLNKNHPRGIVMIDRSNNGIPAFIESISKPKH